MCKRLKNCKAFQVLMMQFVKYKEFRMIEEVGWGGGSREEDIIINLFKNGNKNLSAQMLKGIHFNYTLEKPL